MRAVWFFVGPATPFPAGVSEFDEAQIEREPSAVVRPPRVAGAPVALACKFLGEHNVGNGYMVFGEVVHIAALHTVLAADGLPDARLVAPVTRLVARSGALSARFCTSTAFRSNSEGPVSAAAVDVVPAEFEVTRSRSTRGFYGPRTRPSAPTSITPVRRRCDIA